MTDFLLFVIVFLLFSDHYIVKRQIVYSFLLTKDYAWQNYLCQFGIDNNPLSIFYCLFCYLWYLTVAVTNWQLFLVSNYCHITNFKKLIDIFPIVFYCFFVADQLLHIVKKTNCLFRFADKRLCMIKWPLSSRYC